MTLRILTNSTALAVLAIAAAWLAGCAVRSDEVALAQIEARCRASLDRGACMQAATALELDRRQAGRQMGAALQAYGANRAATVYQPQPITPPARVRICGLPADSGRYSC